jgi:hypothetical protein
MSVDSMEVPKDFQFVLRNIVELRTVDEHWFGK